MNVKVLCKLESYLLPLTSTSELTQFFSPPQHATASSLLPPKSRRLIPAVLSTSAAWREGLSEDPEGAWTSPPPPPQRACALSTAPPPSGAGTVAWVMGNVALGHCVAAWLFLHYSGYSFRLNKDQRPRLLSQATWVPMLVPPMTGEVTGIRTNTSQYLLSIQIRQPCSEGFSCISSDDLHNNLMRSAQLLFSYSGQWRPKCFSNLPKVTLRVSGRLTCSSRWRLTPPKDVCEKLRVVSATWSTLSDGY